MSERDQSTATIDRDLAKDEHHESVFVEPSF